MRFVFVLIFIGGPAVAQAPPAATLWDLPATTLAVPAALESGVASTFWNPAAIIGNGALRLGMQAIQTPETIGLTGVLVAASYPMARDLTVGVVFGRVQVGDLVRTSDSPVSEPGEIPVYEQTVGLTVGTRIGPVTLAGLLRGHDARFDIFRTAGLTADLGLHLSPLPGLRVAAATRFVPLTGEFDTPSRYYAAVEYQLRRSVVWAVPVLVLGRYGALANQSGGLEHSLGAGVDLASRLRMDAAFTREAGAARADWRLALSLGIRAGRYDVLASRATGLRGIGANYRVGLEVDFGR